MTYIHTWPQATPTTQTPLSTVRNIDDPTEVKCLGPHHQLVRTEEEKWFNQEPLWMTPTGC